jgi:hypothetical protein
MNAKKLQKMFTSGDSGEVQKACNELSAGLAKLEQSVAALEAQPITLPTSYRVLDKSHDDPLAHADRHGSLNGHAVNLDQLNRDVRKFAGVVLAESK